MQGDGRGTGRVEKTAERVVDTAERVVDRVSDVTDRVGDRVTEGVAERVDTVVEAVAGTVETVKPKLRGWLHAGTFPLAVTAGVVLVALSPPGVARATTAVYAVSAALLFGVSGLYHRGRWSPAAHGVLKRLDHATIFLIIAGTYTPFTALLLDDRPARTLLWTVWGGALAGVAFRVLWVGAPRWLYTPVYLALGWAAAFYLPDFARSGGAAVLTLITTGGLLYSVGGVVYAIRRPDPAPRWFGFHEVFHALTLVAFVVHFVAVSLVVSATS